MTVSELWSDGSPPDSACGSVEQFDTTCDADVGWIHVVFGNYRSGKSYMKYPQRQNRNSLDHIEA